MKRLCQLLVLSSLLVFSSQFLLAQQNTQTVESLYMENMMIDGALKLLSSGEYEKQKQGIEVLRNLVDAGITADSTLRIQEFLIQYILSEQNNSASYDAIAIIAQMKRGKDVLYELSEEVLKLENIHPEVRARLMYSLPESDALLSEKTLEIMHKLFDKRLTGKYWGLSLNYQISYIQSLHSYASKDKMSVHQCKEYLKRVDRVFNPQYYKHVKKPISTMLTNPNLLQSYPASELFEILIESGILASSVSNKDMELNLVILELMATVLPHYEGLAADKATVFFVEDFLYKKAVLLYEKKQTYTVLPEHKAMMIEILSLTGLASERAKITLKIIELHL